MLGPHPAKCIFCFQILCAFVTLITAATRTIADDFPVPYNSEKSVTTPMAPEEVVATAKLPPGFSLSVFASEPDICNPIAITTDSQGRLWVAENYTWSGAGFGSYDTTLRDRIVVLSDRDGDGRHDDSTVFWDGGRKLTSIEVGLGGVWALNLPHLIFIPDRNGDLVPDGPPEIVLDGLDEQAVGHTPANGLKWGPDGWLYGRHGIQGTSRIGVPGSGDSQRIQINTGVWRFHPIRKVVEDVMHGMTNSWGSDFDSNGEMFVINTVIGHLWHVVQGAHVERMYGTDLDRYVYDLIPQTADHVHWDTGEHWNDIRNGVSDKTSAAGGGHAHIGLMIYQGDNWPKEFRDRVYTLNMHGRRINSDILEPLSAGFTARHGPDFCFIADPWYRGMDLITGQDGGVFIADWSDTGECHDHDGVHRTSGRIYKLIYGTSPHSRPIDVAQASFEETKNYFLKTNRWWGRQVVRAWQGRAARGESLEKENKWLVEMLKTKSEPAWRMQCLWALSVTGGLSESILLEALEDSDAFVRSWALRLLVEECSQDGKQPSAESLKRILAHAQNDVSGPVQMHLASSLSRLSDETRWQVAERLCLHSEFSADRMLSKMIWYGIEPSVLRDPSRCVQLASNASLPQVRRNCARRLSGEIESLPKIVDSLFVAASHNVNSEACRDTLLGAADGLRGWRQAPAPESWKKVSLAFAGSTDEQTLQAVRELDVLFGEGRGIEQVRLIASDSRASADARRQAIRTLVSTSPEDGATFLQGMLGDRTVISEVLAGLARYDHPDTPSLILQKAGMFTPADRATMIDTLVARPAYAKAMLDAVESGTIAKEEISAFHARQIAECDDEKLSEQLARVWGQVRVSAADRKILVTHWKEKLDAKSLAESDRSNGRAIFAKSCASCHVLFGAGRKLGPDLTGSNRKNLDYLLENVIDPSASVGSDFRAVSIVLQDGRVITGVISSTTERTLTVQTVQDSVTIDRNDIAEQSVTPQSLMPDGMLTNLSDDQIRELFSYLMSADQVPLPTP